MMVPVTVAPFETGQKIDFHTNDLRQFSTQLTQPMESQLALATGGMQRSS